jgi:hypothetical protein
MVRAHACPPVFRHPTINVDVARWPAHAARRRVRKTHRNVTPGDMAVPISRDEKLRTPMFRDEELLRKTDAAGDYFKENET